jgi:hypothetical protein
MHLLMSLEQWLASSFEKDVLIPAHPGEKRPAFAHADDVWDWGSYRRAVQNQSPKNNRNHVGILLHDLCVVDVDDKQTCASLEARFPMLRRTIRAQTKRGMHYYFVRSELANRDGYYDGRSQVTSGIDFKTRSSTGNRGFVMCCPSPDKEWVLAPWDADLTPIPDELLVDVATPRHKLVSARIMLLDGSMDVLNSPWLGRCQALTPVFEDCAPDGEVPTIPMPFNRRTLETMLDTLDNHGVPGHVLSDTDIQELCRLVDFLGLPPPCQFHFDDNRPLNRLQVQTDLRNLDPEWASTVYTKKRTLCEVTGNVPIRYEPVRSRFDDRWLLSQCAAPDIPIGANVLHLPPEDATLASLCWKRIPYFLQSFLRRHSKHISLAGGSVMGMLSPYVKSGSDLDIFVHGCEAAAATAIVRDALASFPSIAVATRTGAAVTIAFEEHASCPPIQIVLMIFDSLESVLYGFDIDACRVALHWDPAKREPTIHAALPWFSSMKRMAVWLNPADWNASSVYRIFKYYGKGFDVFLPGCVRTAMVSFRNQCDRRSHFPGIYNVFFIEAVLEGRGSGQDLLRPRPCPDTIWNTLHRRCCWGNGSGSGYDERLWVRGATAVMHSLQQLVRQGWIWLSNNEPLRIRGKGSGDVRDMNLDDILTWRRRSTDCVLYRRSPRVGLLYDKKTYKAAVERGLQDVRRESMETRMALFRHQKMVHVHLQAISTLTKCIQRAHCKKTKTKALCPICNITVWPRIFNQHLLADHFMSKHCLMASPYVRDRLVHLVLVLPNDGGRIGVRLVV